MWAGDFGAWEPEGVEGLAAVVEAGGQKPLLNVFAENGVAAQGIVRCDVHNVAELEFEPANGTSQARPGAKKILCRLEGRRDRGGAAFAGVQSFEGVTEEKAICQAFRANVRLRMALTFLCELTQLVERQRAIDLVGGAVVQRPATEIERAKPRVDIAAAVNDEEVAADFDRVIGVRNQCTKLDPFSVYDQRKIWLAFNQAKAVGFDLVQSAMPLGHRLAVEPEVRAFA